MKRITLQDIFIALTLMIIAIIPRVIMIDTIPLGIHGDEAWTGLVATTILSEGYVPAYSTSALGQPSGPAYLTALFFKLFGISVVSLRLSMAFFGIITIPILYFFLKKLFGSTVSVIITLLFSFSLIHLHFSRIGFMLISAPFFVIGTLYYFSCFLSKKKYLPLTISAVLCGLGMYSYNSYILFPPLMLLAFIYLFFAKKLSWKHVLYFITVFTVTASLLLIQITSNPKEYFAHHKTISIFNQTEFKTGNPSEKLQFMYKNGFKKTKAFFIGHQNDGADGYGDFQSIDYIILALATGGLVTAIFKRNKYMLWFCIGLILQMIPLVSTVDGYYRRVLVAYIFLYVFAAYALHEALNATHIKQQIGTVTIISLFAVAQITLNLWQYFMVFPGSSIAQFVFSPGVYVGLNALDDNSDIILYSERYSCEYETFRFLLKGRTCIHYLDEHTRDDTDTHIKIYIDSFIPMGLKDDNAIRLYDSAHTVIAVLVKS